MTRALLLFLCLLAWPGKPDARYERSPDMATNIWQGTTGNWDTGANWSLTVKPVTGDFVIFDGDISQQSVTSGQDNEGAVLLSGLWSQPSYRGSVGTSSLRLVVGFQADKQLVWRGAGSLHLTSDANVRVVCDSANLLDAVSLYGLEDEIICKRGKVIVTATHAANVGHLRVIGGIVELLENGAFDILRSWLVSGEVINNRPIDTGGAEWVVSGGLWTQSTNGSTSNALTLTGGRVVWNTGTTLAVAEQYGGFLDFADTGEEKTLGKLTIFGGDFRLSTQTANAGFHDFRPDYPDIP